MDCLGRRSFLCCTLPEGGEKINELGGKQEKVSCPVICPVIVNEAKAGPQTPEEEEFREEVCASSSRIYHGSFEAVREAECETGLDLNVYARHYKQNKRIH